MPLCCEDGDCDACKVSAAERAAHVSDGWEAIEDWEKFVLKPGARVVECKPSSDGQAIFYKVQF